MNEYKEIGKRIGHVLRDLEAKEITVTKISVFQQALQGRMDCEMMLNGTLLFHFKEITDEEMQSIFAGITLIYMGNMTIRHNLPILNVTKEGSVQYKETSVHTSQQFKSDVEVKDYYKVIKHENVFQTSPDVRQTLEKQMV